MIRPAPSSTLFPYTTLFRSDQLSLDTRGLDLSISKGFGFVTPYRSEEHTSELQSHHDLVCRLLLEKKKKTVINAYNYDRTIYDLSIRQSPIVFDEDILNLGL